MKVVLAFDGRSSAQGSPLLCHNERLADPLDPTTRAVAEISSKRKKTEADHLELARREFEGGLYLGENGPMIPAANMLRCVEDGARRVRKGKDVNRGIVPLEDYADLDYAGPRDVDTLWQEGCTFPDDPLAFTAPAVATVSARWLNPSSGVRLVVLADRLYEVLITEGQPSLQRRWMQSGAGTLWFEVTDASKQVWSVDSQAFRCADGGHLEVAIEATIVRGRPSLRARYEGHGCQATGPLRQKCGSDRRRPGRTQDSACFLPFPNARCCSNAKGPV